ncbi:unnamed protein product [Oncorhynchus mykiss]|uniref:Uncharacterized protein n=1 Tax=Oncorhynchus mykiss TaxID=8022 RepID=A0A060WA59_ONCMY|nr:unnamed protein product [Oncorhynchus mykiss]
MRGIRTQMESLITGLPPREISAMSLGLAHSLSRYKLKFSPDKVDTMIVQAICKYLLLDQGWASLMGIRRISGTGKAMAKSDKYQHKSDVKVYDPSGDSTLPSVSKKRKFEEVEEEEVATPVTVKTKKPKKEPVEVTLSHNPVV